MMTYKGFIATKENGWWMVRRNGALCIQTRGTQREVKQAIDSFLRERMAS